MTAGFSWGLLRTSRTAYLLNNYLDSRWVHQVQENWFGFCGGGEAALGRNRSNDDKGWSEHRSLTSARGHKAEFPQGCIRAFLLGKGVGMRRLIEIACVAVVVLTMSSMATAVSIPMVPVGDPGNTGEWSGESYGGYGPDRITGAVPYTYSIGKYEVTNAQYTAFRNREAAPNGDVGTDADVDMEPVYNVSFWDAARFCNWLHNGQGNGDTETGSYTLNGYNGPDGAGIVRNP